MLAVALKSALQELCLDYSLKPLTKMKLTQNNYTPTYTWGSYLFSHIYSTAPRMMGSKLHSVHCPIGTQNFHLITLSFDTDIVQSSGLHQERTMEVKIEATVARRNMRHWNITTCRELPWCSKAFDLFSAKWATMASWCSTFLVLASVSIRVKTCGTDVKTRDLEALRSAGCSTSQMWQQKPTAQYTAPVPSPLEVFCNTPKCRGCQFSSILKGFARSAATRGITW
jgi:hypothetical protein